MDSPKSKKPRRSAQAPKPKCTPSGTPLHLSTLPRFHPATFSSLSSSNSSSFANTPASSSGPTPRNGYPPPLSPRTQQRMYEAQAQLSYYQQHMIAQYAGRDSSISGSKPMSPKLAPTAASPGPVTPLELEERNDYLGSSILSTSGNGFFGGGSVKPSSVEMMKREEGKRRSGGESPRRKN